jgi:hypothetical protein
MYTQRGLLVRPQPGPNTKLLIMHGLVPRADAKLVILKGLLLKNVLPKDLRISGSIQMV